MNEIEIGNFYKRLRRREKGRFAAYLSVEIGGSPHSWQMKMISWSRGNETPILSPIIIREIKKIISEQSWRTNM